MYYVFTLLYNVNVCSKSRIQIYNILKYPLENTFDDSRTYSVHIKHLSLKYELPEPLHHLRIMAAQNIRMKYLNVLLSVLRGGHHPDLANIIKTIRVQRREITCENVGG